MATITRDLNHKEWAAAIEREEKAFSKILPDLLNTLRGNYVAIYQGKLVGSDTDESRLVDKMFDRYGYVPFFIEIVEEEPPVVEIPYFEFND